MAIGNETLIDLTAEIAAAHLENNSVSSSEVASLIETIYAALQGLGSKPEPVEVKPQGAVSVRASVKPDHIVSMIDGKPYKMLKRHLSLNGYTPDSYRKTFDLPSDYPMVAAAYSERRRTLALNIGLGRKKAEQLNPPLKTRSRKLTPAYKAS